MRKQAEEMRRVWEAREREEQEKEEALLRAAEEEEEWEAERKRQEEEEKQQQVEATWEAEQEYRAQGWRFDESLEEFQQHQQREEKWREVDTKDWGPCLGCQSRKIDCV